MIFKGSDQLTWVWKTLLRNISFHSHTIEVKFSPPSQGCEAGEKNGAGCVVRCLANIIKCPCNYNFSPLTPGSEASAWGTWGERGFWNYSGVSCFLSQMLQASGRTCLLKPDPLVSPLWCWPSFHNFIFNSRLGDFYHRHLLHLIPVF